MSSADIALRELSAKERAPLYAFASRLLLAEVDAELYERLASPALRPLLVRADLDCDGWLDDAWCDARDEALREEYARLFLLPGGVPPFASAWLDGDRDKLGAQVHAFVTAALESLGRELDTSRPWGRLPLDHLGLLLELVAAACEDGSEHASDVAEHICREALGPWVASLGTALVEKARVPLYRALGRLLHDLHA